MCVNSAFLIFSLLLAVEHYLHVQCVCVCVHLILIICHYMPVHVIRYQLIQVLMRCVCVCVCADSLRVWSVPLTVFIIIVEHKSGVLISHA